MSSNLTPQTFWSIHPHQAALQDNVENVLGAVAHLTLKYWKTKMFFMGALDDREIRFPIPRSLVFALRFLGEVPERRLQSKDA